MRRVIMRAYLALVLLAAGACATSATPEGEPAFHNVRERLSQPTRLYIAPGTSTGEIMASRYTNDGWVAGTTALTIDNGELHAVLDNTGKLAVTGLTLSAADIAIPESVFGKPASLTNVKVSLPYASLANVIWQSDDDAMLTLTLALDLDWDLSVNGAVSPLGTQHLPPVTVTTEMTGAGDHVDASLALDATGELWSWAGLFKLTELKLDLAAATVDAN
ncbi:MAG: hypothetical protein JO257_17680 [Deltaproteobacteria bacterium]|nr:hypothetical protein [Deltaproteobacteria bacterium]